MTSLFRRSSRFAAVIAVFALAAVLQPLVSAQGVAVSGRRAQPRRPLPEGTKLPRIAYSDIARQAGLTGVNISGAEKGKEYIVETTGTGVAIFDYDNDGLMDLFFVNGDRFGDKGRAIPTSSLSQPRRTHIR